MSRAGPLKGRGSLLTRALPCAFCGRCGPPTRNHCLSSLAGAGRIRARARTFLPEDPRPWIASADAPAPVGQTPDGSAPDGFAATVALTTGESAAHAQTTAPINRAGLLSAAVSSSIQSLRYVFAYVRGRRDAEQRRRRLIEERDGARRLVDGAFAELGQLVRADAAGKPELASLIEAIARPEARRDTAIADLAAVEKFQATDDVRLARGKPPPDR